MSIIYNALNKTQKYRESIPTPTPTIYAAAPARKTPWVKISILITLCSLLIFAVTNYPYLIKYKHSKHIQTATAKQPIKSMQTFAQSTQAPTVQVASKNLTPSNATLNLHGIIVADENKIAVINNYPYKLGESVNGMKITEINANTVKLQNGNEFLELKTMM